MLRRHSLMDAPGLGKGDLEAVYIRYEQEQKAYLQQGSGGDPKNHNGREGGLVDQMCLPLTPPVSSWETPAPGETGWVGYDHHGHVACHHKGRYHGGRDLYQTCKDTQAATATIRQIQQHQQQLGLPFPSYLPPTPSSSNLSSSYSSSSSSSSWSPHLTLPSDPLLAAPLAPPTPLLSPGILVTTAGLVGGEGGGTGAGGFSHHHHHHQHASAGWRGNFPVGGAVRAGGVPATTTTTTTATAPVTTAAAAPSTDGKANQDWNIEHRRANEALTASLLVPSLFHPTATVTSTSHPTPSGNTLHPPTPPRNSDPPRYPRATAFTSPARKRRRHSEPVHRSRAALQAVLSSSTATRRTSGGGSAEEEGPEVRVAREGEELEEVESERRDRRGGVGVDETVFLGTTRTTPGAACTPASEPSSSPHTTFAHSASPPPTTATMDDKRQRRLLRNREAARKNRERKKEWVEHLKLSNARMLHENRQLEERVQVLREEFGKLRLVLREYGYEVGEGRLDTVREEEEGEQEEEVVVETLPNSEDESESLSDDDDGEDESHHHQLIP